MAVSYTRTVIHRARGQCPPDDPTDFPNGSCCFKWDAYDQAWEYVAGSSTCKTGYTCWSGALVQLVKEFDDDYVRITCEKNA